MQRCSRRDDSCSRTAGGFRRGDQRRRGARQRGSTIAKRLQGHAGRCSRELFARGRRGQVVRSRSNRPQRSEEQREFADLHANDAGAEPDRRSRPGGDTPGLPAQVVRSFRHNRKLDGYKSPGVSQRVASRSHRSLAQRHNPPRSSVTRRHLQEHDKSRLISTRKRNRKFYRDLPLRSDQPGNQPIGAPNQL